MALRKSERVISSFLDWEVLNDCSLAWQCYSPLLNPGNWKWLFPIYAKPEGEEKEAKIVEIGWSILDANRWSVFDANWQPGLAIKPYSLSKPRVWLLIRVRWLTNRSLILCSDCISCSSTVLTRTNLMLGRNEASAMAIASLASSLLPLTNGFTC